MKTFVLLRACVSLERKEESVTFFDTAYWNLNEQTPHSVNWNRAIPLSLLMRRYSLLWLFSIPVSIVSYGPYVYYPRDK